MAITTTPHIRARDAYVSWAIGMFFYHLLLVFFFSLLNNSMLFTSSFMLLPVCPTSPRSTCKYDVGLVYLFCFHLGQPPHHSHCHQPSNDEGHSDHNLNHSSATTSHWCVFFWPFICFYIFTKQLYSFRLHYYTWPPLLTQTWHGVNFVCFICTRNSHHITATSTNRVMTKPPPQLEPQPLNPLQHLMSLVCFFFCRLHLFLYWTIIWF